MIMIMIMIIIIIIIIIINEDVLTYIADTEQEPGIKIIRKDVESKSSDVNPVIFLETCLIDYLC